MKHGKKSAIPKLGRDAGHRKALMRALSCALLTNEKIQTTQPKAKALRCYIEPLITRAGVDSVHNRRMVNRRLCDRKILKKLFDEIAPRYKERPGGYTRILKLGSRQGDRAEIVQISLV